MLQLTEREERLVLRRRKAWHKVLRCTWYTVSTLLLCIGLFVPTIMLIQARRELEYQNSIEAIQAVSRTAGTQPTFFISADRYARSSTNSSEEARLAADYVEVFMRTSDSLNLDAGKRLGMRLEIAVVPCGLFGKRHSAAQAWLYTSPCGCDTDSTIDEIVLQLDSTGRSANVICSRKKTLASIQP